MNVVIITGASSGIGMEFAMQMDAYFSNIDQFWLVARNRKRLEEVARYLQHPVQIWDIDITEKDSLEALEREAGKHHATVRMLINCAGYGIMGDFASQERETQLGMIRLNCEALTDITHRLLPYMRRGSRIIQLSSSAAFVPQTDFAVYAATKSYVLSFSRALNEELKDRGICVTAVCPGPVNTPFFAIAEKTGQTLAIKKVTMVEAEDVVAQALKDSYYRRSVSVYSLPIRAFRVFAKLAPHNALLGGMRLLKKIQ